MIFRWNQANRDHLAEHGILPVEAEYVVEFASDPYPRRLGQGKYVVRGQTWSGVYLQVI